MQNFGVYLSKTALASDSEEIRGFTLEPTYKIDAIQHNLIFRFYIRLQRHQYGFPPPATGLRDETPYQPRACTAVQDGREIVLKYHIYI